MNLSDAQIAVLVAGPGTRAQVLILVSGEPTMRNARQSGHGTQGRASANYTTGVLVEDH
jgi:hypothetical protein